jgi:hypothetical protein
MLLHDASGDVQAKTHAGDTVPDIITTGKGLE